MSCIQITAKSPTISRPQVDHSCVGRNLLAMGGIAALVSGVAARKNEIPAFAGMVLWGTGIYRQIRHCRRPPLSPTQSPNPPTIPRPQADHSCVGRNLTVSCIQITVYSPTIPRTQPDHSCVGRNLLAMGGIAALVSGVAARKNEIPAFAGMVFFMDSDAKKTISNPPNIRAQLLKFSYHVFITAVEMINAVNDTFAVCRQGGDD